MLHIHIIAALMLVLFSASLATAQKRAKPARHPAKRIEQTILQLEREIMAAIKNKDTRTLSRILADDFIHRSPAGPDLRRDEFLKQIYSIPVRILMVWGENLKVQVYGEFGAVLTGVQRARTASDDGREETSAGAFTDIFVKRKGRWLLAMAYTVDLPAATAEQQPASQTPSRK